MWGELGGGCGGRQVSVSDTPGSLLYSFTKRDEILLYQAYPIHVIFEFSVLASKYKSYPFVVCLLVILLQK